MTRILDRLDRLALRFLQVQWPWWAWPSALVALAVAALGASFLLHPGGDEFVYFPGGTKFGDRCAFLVIAGAPCPQCGMTRSWVHAVRLDLESAILYNPAGVALLGWILVGGVVGAARLIRRDPEALRAPVAVNVGWSLFWLIGLYLVPWIARLFGVNPLP